MYSSAAQHLHSTLKVLGSILKTFSSKKLNPTQPKTELNQAKPSRNKTQKATELGELATGF